MENWINREKFEDGGICQNLGRSASSAPEPDLCCEAEAPEAHTGITEDDTS